MIGRTWLLSLVVVVACSGEGAQQVAECPRSQAIAGALVGDWLEPDSITFTIDSVSYVVNAEGHAIRRSSQGPQAFTIPLPGPGFHLEKLYALAVFCDLIVVPQYSDGESAAGDVSRLSAGSLHPLWTAAPFGFNIAEPLLDSLYLYIASVGTVAKLDLRSGAYIWRHDDLYDPQTGAYNTFRQPAIAGDTVVFTSEVRGGQRQLRLDRATGTIIRR
jgi:hypothetical protein